jgi:transcriptional regulator GlxA family with amidase domain
MAIYNGCQLLDSAGPADVFDAANRSIGTTSYCVVTASPDGHDVEASVTIRVDTSLGAVAERGHRIDTLVVTGGFGALSDAVVADVARYLPLLARQSRRVASVCTGSLLLAAAGLLRALGAAILIGGLDPEFRSWWADGEAGFVV